MTPQAIDDILQDFRTWLEDAARQGTAPAAAAEEPEFQWQTLVAEFTALRHEVNLQTRAARAQLEQQAQTLVALEEARRTGADATDETMRPLLKTLVDLYDALALARREVQRVQTAVESVLVPPSAPLDSVDRAVRVDEPHPAPAQKRPWWRWWSTAPSSEETTAVLLARIVELQAQTARQQQQIGHLRRERDARSQAIGQIRQFLNSVVTGYTMSLERIHRALAQHQLETIACVGQPFDPECMEVVEVVTEPGRSGTEVLDEVRRGYRWKGRLFRPAQVRVARP